MNVIKKLHAIYGLLIFVTTFLLLWPVFLAIIANKRWHVASYHVNKAWARVFFACCFIPCRIIHEERLDPSGTYIYCPNHASFLDIPLMGFAPTPFQFVGKRSIAKAPLFGYMFKKLHITVDRASLRGKHGTHLRSLEALGQGKSLVIFPEGGILSESPPNMAPFKNGAFKAAIAKQIPIIPVTIPYNWIILPDNGKLQLHRKKAMVVFHPPIPTKGLGMEDLKGLKEKTFRTISEGLQNYG